MNSNDVILELSNITENLLSGKRKIKIDLDIDSVEDEFLKTLATGVVEVAKQYMECHGFIVDLSHGRLCTEAPKGNAFANPFKQLHSELRHLTWQIQQIAGGDLEQRVSFSGDFSDAINKMIDELRERQALSEQIRENENLFRSIFRTSPEGIILCDLCHCIIHASNAALRMFNADWDTIIGKAQYDDFIFYQDIDKYKGLVNSLMEGSGISFAELRVVLLDGTIFWTEQNVSILLDSNSEPKGYIIVVRDISERKAAEAQLLQYTDELNESNMNKDKLFSIISHDLKSPFNALLGTSNAIEYELSKETADVNKIKKYSKILNDSASRTFGLVNNLLEWARLQADRIELKPEQFKLNEIIVENITIAQTAAIGKNISIEFVQADVCSIVSDRAIINTILRNLISNAIKYTPQNGQIIVSMMQAENIYVVSVQDNGMGIHADKIDKLFDSENLESTPGTANEKGTGLGLGLCKEFVTKIGGEIWVESVFGQGATFSFTLINIS